MTELAKEYGDGLYALAREEGLMAELLEQMTGVEQLFREEPDFLRLLGNMSLPKAERVNILDNAFRGQVHPYLLNFLKILCERGSLNEFSACRAAYYAVYRKEFSIAEATVTTAAPLNETQRAQLLEKLTGMTGKQIVLHEKLDESLMGGVLLEMEGRTYDNTVRNRLKNVHEAMVQEM